MNSLALVTLRVVAHIDIPDSVIGIVDLDHIGIGIKRHLILKNVVNFAFFILKQNVACLVDYFDAAAEGWKRIFRTQRLNMTISAFFAISMKTDFMFCI